MSTGVFVQDATEAREILEQQRLLERASVEPEPGEREFSTEPEFGQSSEIDALLGYSKRAFPKRLYLLLGVVALFTISAISTMPAGLDITYRFVCHFLEIEQSQCLRSDAAGETVTNFTAVGSVIRGSLSLVVASYLSALSDRCGRKPIIVSAMVLTGVAHLSSWYIVFHLPNPSTYWWLMVPTVVDGLGGGAQIVTLMCVAYVSDVVGDPRQRARLIAVLDGCFFGSLAMGPTLGSLVIRHFSIETLYVATTVGALLAAALTALLLRESLSTFHRRRNSSTKRDIRSVMQRTLDLLSFRSIEDPRRRRNARVISVCALCGIEFVATFLSVQMLYPKRVFGWSAVEAGYLVSAMSSTRTAWFLAGFTFLLERLSRVWTVHSDQVDRVDLALLRAGIVFTAVGYFLMGWSTTPTAYFISGIIEASSSVGLPIYKSAMIKHIPAGQFGQFMAGFNLLNATIGVFGPTLFLRLYSWAFTWRPFLPFEVVGSLFVGLLLATFLLKPSL